MQARGAGAPNISVQTIRRRLHQAGLRSRIPAEKLHLLDRHMRARLQWAREKQNFTQAQWDTCLFSDESRFCLAQGDRRHRVWRRRHERRNALPFIRRRELFGGGGIMVWGGISKNGKTDLVIIDGNLTARRYRDEILETHVRPYAGAVGPEFILVDDNARPHRGFQCDAYLEHEGIERMVWPAKSPDMNPIEKIWAIMKWHVHRRLRPFHTLLDLRRIVREEWQNIPIETVNNCINSMPRRVAQCVQYNGAHTDYF